MEEATSKVQESGGRGAGGQGIARFGLAPVSGLSAGHLLAEADGHSQEPECDDDEGPHGMANRPTSPLKPLPTCVMDSSFNSGTAWDPAGTWTSRFQCTCTTVKIPTTSALKLGAQAWLTRSST